MSNNDLFDSDTDDQSDLPPERQETDRDFVSELVGEGKKFKDIQALAKSLAYKDSHISQIENENAELRQKVQQSLSLEEFYDKVKSSGIEPNPSPSNRMRDEEERSELSVEQVNALLEQRLARQRLEDTQQRNLDYATNVAKEKLGPNFRRLLRERARELGESEDDLTKLAMVKPKVFLELMVPSSVQNSHTPGIPRPSVDSGKSTMPGGEVRDAAYYRKLKQADPEKFKSRKVQIQMHNDAMSLGEKFFN